MKKLLTLCMLLCTVFTGAWAQTSGFRYYKPVHIAAAAEGYFVIDAVDQASGNNELSNHHFIYDNNGSFATATTIDSNNFDKYVWHVTANGDGTYKFQNVSTSRCIAIGTGNSDGQSMTLTDAGTGVHFDFASGYAAIGNGNNQWYDCGNAGSATSTWSGGVGGSRRMRVHEALTSVPTYTIMCKKSSRYATYNTNAVESGITYLATATGTPGNNQKIVLESASNGYFKMRIGIDTEKYVYAINTNDADANVGICTLGSNETGTEDKYLWKLKLNTEGYYNIIPKAGNNGWNVRGTKNSIGSLIGQWSENGSDDNRWQFTETEPYFDSTFPSETAGTYYVTFQGQKSGRNNCIYNDLTHTDGYTLQTSSFPSSLSSNNNFIWKIQIDGQGGVTSYKNGQGGTNAFVVKSGGNKCVVNSLEYEKHNDYFYFKITSATPAIKSDHNCLNVAKTSDEFKDSQDGVTLTTWDYTKESGNAGDNLWDVRCIDTRDLMVYNVEVSGSNEGYAIWNGQNAANGGFYLVKGELSGVTAKAIAGKKYEITINDESKTITVAYSTASEVSVTYTVTQDGETLGTFQATEYAGSAPLLTDIPDYITVTEKPELIQEGVTNYNITTEYNNNLPFNFSKKFKFKLAGYFVYANSNANNAKESTTYNDNNDYKWRIGGNWLTGFTFKNMSGYYLGAPSTDLSNGTNTTIPTEESELTRFRMVQNGSYGYRLIPVGGNNYVAHTSQNDLNVQYYDYYKRDNSYNNGNKVSFEEIIIPVDVTITYNAGKHNWTENDTYYEDDNMQEFLEDGFFNKEFYTNLALQGSDFIVSESNNNFTINCTEDFPFVVGKLCRINNVLKNHDLYVKTGNESFTYTSTSVTQTLTGNIAYYDGTIPANSNIWCFEHVAGTQDVFMIKNSLSGAYLTFQYINNGRCSALMEATAIEEMNADKTSYMRVRKSTAANKGDNGFVLQHPSRVGLCCSVHVGNDVASEPKVVSSWKAGSEADALGNATNTLRIYNMEDVTATLNPIAGDGYYGTIYNNLNMIVPDGIKAYRATLNGETLHLDEVEGELPAGAYVLYKSDAGATAGSEKINTTFTMTNTTAADEENVLTGTLEEGKTFASDLRYALSGKNGIGFYKYNPNTYPVAKAVYIPKDGTTSVNAFYFDFGNGEQTTGIEQMIEQISELNNQDAAIFDLQGRRIQKMQKGMNIINGRKVLR